MAKNIDPQLKTLSEYFDLKKNDEIFAIPEYQREYSWTKEQCDKLWEDIDRFMSTKGDDPYFFGTIIADCSQNGKINLIDGQQRTTTFILLLKALLIKILLILKSMPVSDETSSLKAGLKGRSDTIIKILYKIDDDDLPAFLKNSQQFTKKTIIENKSINEIYKEELKIILSADNFEQAENNVYKIPKKQKDNKYTTFFKNFKFFYKDKIEPMNETNINELAKILLNKCQVIEIRSWNVEHAIVMFNSLNSTGLPLTDADIISADLYSKFTDEEEKKKFIESWQSIIKGTKELKDNKVTDIDEILNQYMYIKRALLNENDTTLPSRRNYFKNWHPEFLGEPKKFIEDIESILNLWVNKNNNKICFLQKIIAKFSPNFKLFYIPYMFIRMNDSEKLKISFVNALLKIFILLEIVEAGYSSKNFKTFLFNINMEIGKGNRTEEIIEKIYEHINNNFIRDEIKDLLLDISASGSLVTLKEILYAKSKSIKFDFFINNKTINIEHILPNSGRNIKTIRLDAKMNDEEFNNYVNKLGNKILLEENINKSIGNNWFVYKKDKYKDSIFPVAKSLSELSQEEWTKTDIDNATEQSAEEICKYIFSKDEIK